MLSAAGRRKLIAAESNAGSIKIARARNIVSTDLATTQFQQQKITDRSEFTFPN